MLSLASFPGCVGRERRPGIDCLHMTSHFRCIRGGGGRMQTEPADCYALQHPFIISWIHHCDFNSSQQLFILTSQTLDNISVNCTLLKMGCYSAPPPLACTGGGCYITPRGVIHYYLGVIEYYLGAAGVRTGAILTSYTLQVCSYTPQISPLNIYCYQICSLVYAPCMLRYGTIASS